MPARGRPRKYENSTERRTAQKKRDCQKMKKTKCPTGKSRTGKESEKCKAVGVSVKRCVKSKRRAKYDTSAERNDARKASACRSMKKKKCATGKSRKGKESEKCKAVGVIVKRCVLNKSKSKKSAAAAKKRRCEKLAATDCTDPRKTRSGPKLKSCKKVKRCVLPKKEPKFRRVRKDGSKGGLSAEQVTKNKRGKTVSKAKHEKGKANRWIKAVMAAREERGVEGFVVLNKGPQGKALYNLAKRIYGRRARSVPKQTKPQRPKRNVRRPPRYRTN